MWILFRLRGFDVMKTSLDGRVDSTPLGSFESTENLREKIEFWCLGCELLTGSQQSQSSTNLTDLQSLCELCLGALSSFTIEISSCLMVEHFCGRNSCDIYCSGTSDLKLL
jgi:hypothetical protein